MGGGVVVTRFGDWAAMILAVAAVFGCVAAVGVLVAGRVASTIRTVKALRVGVAGGPPVAAEQPLKRSARPAALMGAAAVFLMSAWLAGDDLATRYRSGQVLGFGGWLEWAISAALAGCGVRVLALAVRRGRAERVARSTHRVATVGPRSKAVG